MDVPHPESPAEPNKLKVPYVVTSFSLTHKPIPSYTLFPKKGLLIGHS